MKALYLFEKIDWVAFAEGKTFVVTDVRELQDFNSKEHIGTRVECVIAIDKTQYPVKDGKQITNRFEKIVFKVKKDIDVPLDSRVIPKNVVAKAYERELPDKRKVRDQISVTCEDMDVIPPKEK